MSAPEDPRKIPPIVFTPFSRREAQDGTNRQTRQTLHGNPTGQPRNPFTSGAFSTTITFIGARATALPVKPIKRTGIRAGEIIGHRVWLLKDGLLRSAIRAGTVWDPHSHVTGNPSVTCGAGVHAFKAGSEKLSAFIIEVGFFHWAMGTWTTSAPSKESALSKEMMGIPVVVGKVALWGEIVEHEYGYRAEFGKVKSLDRILGNAPDKFELLRAVRVTYGVD